MTGFKQFSLETSKLSVDVMFNGGAPWSGESVAVLARRRLTIYKANIRFAPARAAASGSISPLQEPPPLLPALKISPKYHRECTRSPALRRAWSALPCSPSGCRHAVGSSAEEVGSGAREAPRPREGDKPADAGGQSAQSGSRAEEGEYLRTCLVLLCSWFGSVWFWVILCFCVIL